MRREDKFVMSHGQYAVDLDSLVVSRTGLNSISAVWFRRKQGVTAACSGYLWDVTSVATTALGFLERHTDGRHGGTCEGRWDGDRYWGAQEPAKIEEHLALLRPMLDSFPEVPAGFDGWWTFRPGGES